MRNIRDIMALFGCSETRARQIFEQMAVNGVDFSECTTRQFKSAAARALKELSEADMQRLQQG